MWQTPKAIGPIALFVALIVSGVGIILPADTAYPDDCLAAPNSPAPPGNHWYFRIDWAKKARKCWYFRALGKSGQQLVAQVTSAASARLQLIKPKSASRAAPSATASISTSPAGSAPPVPHLEMLAVELQPAPMIGSGTDQDVERSGRERSSPASSIQGLTLQNVMTQAGLSTPTPAVAALDTTPDAVEQSWRESSRTSIPQALASQEGATPKLTAPDEDMGVDSVRPKDDAPAADNAESHERLFQICVSFLSSQFHGLMALGHEWKIGGILALLVLTFGLPVAGILRLVAMKIVLQRRKLVIDHSAPNLTDNQDQHERRDDQRQQESDLTDSLQTEKSSVARPRNSAPETSRTARREFEVVYAWAQLSAELSSENYTKNR